MALFQMPIHLVNHRNRYISGRIKKNLKYQEICFLYSKEGTRFQINRIVFMQTQRLRDILSSTLCCDGRCTGNSNPPEFFFPDISAVLLKTLIKFFYTGILYCSINDYTTLNGLLTNIFGFPTSMTLTQFTEKQDEFLYSEKPDEYSCKICQEPLKSTNQVYVHLKTHLDQQYDDNLKSFISNQTCSPCCLCAQNLLGKYKSQNCKKCKCFNCKSDTCVQDQENDGARAEIKDRYEVHVQQLNDYMSKKFDWDENNAHVENSIEIVEIDIPFEYSIQNRKEHSSPTSDASRLLRRKTSNENSNIDSPKTNSNCSTSHTMTANVLNSEISNDSSNENLVTECLNTSTSSSNNLLPPLDTSDKPNTDVPLITTSSNNQYMNRSTNDSTQSANRSNQTYCKTVRKSLPHTKTVKQNLEADNVQEGNSTSDNNFCNNKRNEHLMDDILPSKRKKGKVKETSNGNKVNQSDDFTLEITIDNTMSPPTTSSPAPPMENFGYFTCVTCQKKVTSKNRIKHAIQHYPDFLLAESFERSHDDSSPLICSHKDCKFRCLKDLIMREHYAIIHGKLEKYLNEKGKTLSDIYSARKATAPITKKRRISTISSDNDLEINPFSIDQNNQTRNVADMNPLAQSTLNSNSDSLPSNISQKIEVTTEDVNQTFESIEQANNSKNTPSLVMPSAYSPISSDGFSDVDESNRNKTISSIEPSLDRYVPISYPEIDTEAETDLEDIT